MSKYKAKKVEYNGMIFDSKKELKIYQELEQRDDITDLKRQVKYVLVPKQKTPYETFREVAYVADYVYTDSAGVTHVVDCKGMKFGLPYSMFQIKRKLMYQVYGIYVEIV